MKVVCILSDALRHDYIEKMDFLKKMSNEKYYIKKIKPGLGFCEISEYVTGMDSIKNENVFQITFNNKFSSIEGKVKILSKLNNFMGSIPKVRKYTDKIISKYVETDKFYVDTNEIKRVRYNIPLELLKYFKPTESYYKYDDNNFFFEKNIFNDMKKSNISYDIDNFVEHNKIKGTDEERLENLRKKINTKSLKDFTLLYIGYGELAHVLGTKDIKFNHILKQYDLKLKSIYDDLINQYDNDACLVILGDHGMVDVEKYININKNIDEICKKNNLIKGNDIVYFIDSTFVRIWIKDKSKVENIERELKNEYLNDIEPIEFDDRIKSIYGDIIIMLKPGKVFFPDFFNRKKIKGMHGYSNEICEQQGMMLILGESIKKSAYNNLHLHEAKDILLSLLKNSVI
ncbi:alkaline phosphatase family protein [Clostridium butyricum]|uniref:alkaline phosphatase family protein n=1 Tax=Clostridium butyricum TaxID=1492 RepID=UPI0002CC0A36|nr:alkaline phosphatase family protein [Clostridium butyricum]EMU55854.1 hypothetical protein CBDKU1_01960 [Clostridium butyricum DKU-01]